MRYLRPTSILVILSLRAGPRGTCTETVSPRLVTEQRAAHRRLVGDLFSAGFASAEPTIV